MTPAQKKLALFLLRTDIIPDLADDHRLVNDETTRDALVAMRAAVRALRGVKATTNKHAAKARGGAK